MMFFAWVLNVLALLVGVALGVRGLFDPKWVARLVRLREDGPGGGAEFRATYGAMFIGLHLVALAMTGKYLIGGTYVVGVAASGAAAVLAAGWAGAAFGRVVSILRDGADTKFNRASVVFELAMTAFIGAPWAVWYFSFA
ncbi:MAG: hypothetical protein K2P70_10785 [Hyphomonadaceae bacterium]|jgi:hypothetical protein|nr:hypothetical protein [Hyphomonadaceae bacterium]